MVSLQVVLVAVADCLKPQVFRGHAVALPGSLNIKMPLFIEMVFLQAQLMRPRPLERFGN
jgi:hypothetical protein